MRKVIFLLLTLYIYSMSLYGQKSRSYSLFQLLNAGKNKRPANQFEREGTGSLVYRDSMLYGRVLISEKAITVISNDIKTSYSYDDTKLSSIFIVNTEGRVNIVRLKDNDNRLWRLIKDTLGMKVYDKNILYPADGNNIDYTSLVFLSNNRFYEAETFWVTSTKRSIIRIINQLLAVKLSPKKFKGKEDLINRFINNDQKIYSKL